MDDQFHFKIGGAAGEGIMSTGQTFTKFAVRSGYQTFDFVEYPSLVRGGHNTFYGTISKDEVFSTHNRTDLLIALNQETVKLHREELGPGAGVIFDPNEFKQAPIKGVRLFGVPLLKFAEEAGHKLMANTVALGVMVFLTGGDLEVLNSVLKDTFASKKKQVVEGNIRAARAGFDFAKSKFSPLGKFLNSRKKTKKMVIAGNEAIALGAIAGGMKFCSIYPMTPISSILHFLARYEQEAKILLRQPEDEIAGISMALGASFAGLRSMVATSGGGFALMNESLSLAGITETPVVVVFGQRAGPATGIPTWTAQEDLLYALTAAQGEYPRIVLAPGDVEECFYQTAEAFNLAEIYQTPVVILVDKFICEGHKSVPPLDLKKIKVQRGKLRMSNVKRQTSNDLFPRYRLAEGGISPRTYPAKGMIVKANSDEHDEFGLSEESIENRRAQMKKRMRKMVTLGQKIPAPRLYGPKEADLTLVGWGSVKGPVLQALANAKRKMLNVRVNFLHLNWLSPFPVEAVRKALYGTRQTLLVENNFGGQLGNWIRMQTGIEIKERFLKYDGRQFYPGEIKEKIKSMI
jgi:2-oxoglutarate ferredoxin oxidoreductase subunit alpha